jgi:hypothetical protein
VAARIGNAAFFAPEIRISPFNGAPPVMISLSIICVLDLLLQGLPLRRRIGLQ